MGYTQRFSANSFVSTEISFNFSQVFCKGETNPMLSPCLPKHTLTLQKTKTKQNCRKSSTRGMGIATAYLIFHNNLFHLCNETPSAIPAADQRYLDPWIKDD